MKLSFKQIAASVIGAVLAALALSFFGVGGTIVGVALGSAAATIGSGLAFNSLERGHDKVREIVTPITAKWPGADSDQRDATVGRDGFGAAVTTEIRLDDPWARSSEPPEIGASTLPASSHGGDRTREVSSSGGTSDDAVTASHPIPVPTLLGPGPVAASSGVRWPVIAVIALVFALALGTVTVIELMVGKPLNAVVHGTPAPKSPTSIGGVIGGGGAGSTTTTSTTTATTRPATTTSTAPPSTTSTSTTPSTTTPSTSTTTPTSSTTTTR